MTVRVISRGVFPYPGTPQAGRQGRPYDIRRSTPTTRARYASKGIVS
ncbi:MAG TPA: hypothetical protein VKV40_01550 [Ktedonobacteraceae bacterium]|nr:hypothetical protein [Ktedonobacteraceae bacterium]